MKSPLALDRRQVQRNFARAANDYDAVSVFQREIARRLLERLDFVKISPSRILDVGCGTGFDLSALSERYKTAQIVGLDASLPMLQSGVSERSLMRRVMPFLHTNKSSLLCGDATNLPVKSASIDFIWSNLLLHWVDNPAAALREMHRTMAVGGLLMFATLGPDSFKELKASFSEAHQQTNRPAHPHTHPFYDLHDYGDLLLECGFSDPVMDVDRLTMTYPSLSNLLLDLKRNGGSCAASARAKGLMGKATFAAMQAAYTKKAAGGVFPVSFEIIFGHAWKEAPLKTDDGRDIIRFDPKI